ncbi:calcium-binding protein [Actinoplanes couchii]|uniref:Hemolysin-type calcium-binding region n=1 Tax=Actinoplanes couchii TaxID=403638 RepID=A0ABQ3XIF3_9ACTN|nr:calcium-binding protein [Actinoplanes couchii]MDR6324632.1 Ca2+-binding RTX toxin-like protein [Actinoplanes couchii]GID58185.1 hypothetical protein Aco03nite_065890 [Actinoplanes couchii]
MKRIALLSFAVVAGAVVAPAPALAATTGLAKVAGTVVQFKAAAGKTNSLVITIAGRTVTLDDRVAIKAGAGCKAVKGDATKVRCTTAKKTTRLVVALGNGHDEVINRTAVPMTADGGTGDDTLIGGSAADRLLGGSGWDTILGRGGGDTIDGGSGNDRIQGNSGNDVIQGGTGHDTVYGGSGADRVAGGAGDDWIFGGSGNDVLDGGTGNDLIQGESGHDKITGGSGDDQLVGETMVVNVPEGSAKAQDRLDGGPHKAGDVCVVLAAGTTVNCESSQLS